MRSTSRVCGKNQNLVSRIDFGAWSANKVQAIDVAGIAAASRPSELTTRPTRTGNLSARAESTCASVAPCGSDSASVWVLANMRATPNSSMETEIESSTEWGGARLYGKSLHSIPARQSCLVVLRAVHVEKAQTLGIETADFVFVNFAGANLVYSEIGRSSPRSSCSSQKRRDAAPVSGMQRLKSLLPIGHDDIIV